MPILLTSAVLAAYLGIMLLLLHAWPGHAPFWRSVAIFASILAVPDILVSADGNWHSWANVPFAHQGILETVITMNAAPVSVLYDVLLAVGSLWLAWRYYPAIRGWRLAVFWIITDAVLLGLPGILRA
ncbi:MAG: hypothetical protein M0Z66_05580 [Thermaerobacter sp.]|nr:hypothetical protein [Thermaerobacter sp.]